MTKTKDQQVNELIELWKPVFESQKWTATLSSLKFGARRARDDDDIPIFPADIDTKDVKAQMKILLDNGKISRDTNGTYYWMTDKNKEASVKIAKRMDNVEGCLYHDHENVLPALDLFYSMRTPTIIVGPHGSGKTDAVREFARQKGMSLYTVPCSLGLREHQFIGRLDKQDGNVVFKKGPVPLSMEDENGGILYLDELNASEADVLLRLDEVLDARKEVNIEGNTVVANDKWWCVASINPLDHPGTKELPNQLMSRFCERIYLTYPKDDDDEYKIVLKALQLEPSDISLEMSGVIKRTIEGIRQLREANTLELPYNPSLRESIECVKLLIHGVPLLLVTKHVLVAPYYQWGRSIVEKVADFLSSKLGSENVPVIE